MGDGPSRRDGGRPSRSRHPARSGRRRRARRDEGRAHAGGQYRAPQRHQMPRLPTLAGHVASPTQDHGSSKPLCRRRQEQACGCTDCAGPAATAPRLTPATTGAAGQVVTVGAVKRKKLGKMRRLACSSRGSRLRLVCRGGHIAATSRGSGWVALAVSCCLALGATTSICHSSAPRAHPRGAVFYARIT